MPALWITASKRPSLLTSSATVLAPEMVERSPETTPRAPAAAARASRLRSSFRPCRTTSWPCSIRSRAAMRPRPSDDPDMNTRPTPAAPLIAPIYPLARCSCSALRLLAAEFRGRLQFGKESEIRNLGCRRPLLASDREVHPKKIHRCDAEQQHETARPHIGQVGHQAEGQRQHETAEPANRADSTAHDANLIRVIDRDVLEDGGLTERHEEAQDHQHDNEHRESGGDREAKLAVQAVDGVIGCRVG